MRFYLKKFIPVYQSGDLICIGYAKRKKYIELENNSEIYEKVKRAILFGLTEEDLDDDSYSRLFEFD